MSFRSILLILLSLTVTNSAAGQSIIYNKLAGVKGLDSALLQISLGNLPVGKTGAQKAAVREDVLIIDGGVSPSLSQ